ncbi:FAD-dependent monooxygenase [Methylobacterium goesingense]|uniref:2-polyprenyl-6-methoxyphenol hydroxylase-like FAD-dependent oxidoreductase n=1 Tax=Methylobacterium goesingense TaxID=243690 RepID=A0ABV2LBJ5_9HYPH|nr:FAD-dependent monooxygenase [Methylobacterium goesingense]GJD74685.1 6-methylpretetramide 4-monooxygenase [Methylobacterium goesingense]
MADVLVVGAGPVGLTMAAELARYGVGVRLIDHAPHATDTSKALVLWSRTLELMDRMGCTQAFLDAGLRAPGASIRSGTKVLGNPRFDHIASAYNYALMIPQRDTERLLAGHLRSFGIAVERQLELVGFTEAADGVEARLRHADGREETIRTPWLIGCDGAHSTVRHGLGVAFEGSAQGDDWLLADVRLDGPGAPPPDEIATYLHRDGPFVIFPIPGGRARVIATVGKTDGAHPRSDPTLDEVQALVDRRAGGGFRVSDPVWLTNFRINERKVAEYRRGRIFLAGDAAHIHSPAGGQGMNTGMQDAVNLAWKLAMVVRGQAGECLLESYSPERSAVGDMVLRNASRLTDLATLSNPAAQAARNLALRFLLGLHAVRDKMATQMSEIEIAYADSPLSAGSGSGVRWEPDAYEGPAPGAGGEPRFLLYAADEARGAALTGRFPRLLEPAPRKPPNASGFFVVRPDGYVGLSAGEAGWDDAERYFEALAKTDGGHAWGQES